MKQDATGSGAVASDDSDTEPVVRWDGSLVDSDDPEPLFTSLAEAMVQHHNRIAEIARPLADSEIEALVKRCRREAHPEPGDSHNFEIPAWDGTAYLLERELRFRRIIEVLVLEEALRSVSGISNETGEQE